MLQRFTTILKNGLVSYSAYTASTLSFAAPMSTVLNFMGFASGTFYLTQVASSGTTITWYSSPDGILWFPHYDSTNTAVTQTVNSNVADSYQIPSACFGCAYLYPFISGAVNVPAHFSLKG